MKQSRLLCLATALLLSLLAQNTRPLLASGTIFGQPASYSPSDATGTPSSSIARTKKLKIACYPVGGQCTKDSDCCTGFCRVGRVGTYCDH